MLRSCLFLSVLLGICSLFFSLSLQAQETTVVSKQVVVTPAPKSVNCTTVAAHWENNIWIDSQTICRYESRMEGVAWVSDYWACTAVKEDGTCTNWELKPGHWIKTLPE